MALIDAWVLSESLREAPDLDAALARYQAQRHAHVAVYQFWSRWLTPLFQSERDLVARVRDLGMLPAGRMPGGRGHMLRVLRFLQALAETAAASPIAAGHAQGEQVQ